MERHRFKAASEAGTELPDTAELLRIRNWHSLPREQQHEVCEREKKSNLFYWLESCDPAELRSRNTRNRNKRRYAKGVRESRNLRRKFQGKSTQERDEIRKSHHDQTSQASKPKSAGRVATPGFSRVGGAMPAHPETPEAGFRQPPAREYVEVPPVPQEKRRVKAKLPTTPPRKSPFTLFPSASSKALTTPEAAFEIIQPKTPLTIHQREVPKTPPGLREPGQADPPDLELPPRAKPSALRKAGPTQLGFSKSSQQTRKRSRTPVQAPRPTQQSVPVQDQAAKSTSTASPNAEGIAGEVQRKSSHTTAYLELVQHGLAGGASSSKGPSQKFSAPAKVTAPVKGEVTRGRSKEPTSAHSVYVRSGNEPKSRKRQASLSLLYEASQ